MNPTPEAIGADLTWAAYIVQGRATALNQSDIPAARRRGDELFALADRLLDLADDLERR